LLLDLSAFDDIKDDDFYVNDFAHTYNACDDLYTIHCAELK